MKPSTLKDIALAAEVSLATVSLALAGKGRMSPAVRERVLAAAKSLDYHRKPGPRRVAPAGASSPFGILFSIDQDWGLAWWLVRPIVEQLESEMRAKGRTVVMLPMRLDMEDATLAAKIEESRCAGVFSLHFARESLFSRLESAGIAVILIMNGSFQDRFSSVLVDDFQGAYEGASHLIKLGHRDMLYVDTDRPGLPVLSSDRFIGFRKALEENGIELPPERHVRFIMDDSGYLESLIRGIFSSEHRPTAVFAMDDDVAIRVVVHLRAMGLRVPEDVSILAPGDVLKYGDPHIAPITTMRINTQLMGRIAADLMTERIAQPSGEPHVVKIKQQLVQRGSTRSVARRPGRAGSGEGFGSGRERALAAFERRPDAPLARWISVSPEFLCRAAEVLGLDEEGFRRRAGDDFRRVEAEGPASRLPLPPGASSVSPFGVARSGPGYGQGLAHPLAGRFTEAALHDHPWPDPERVDVTKLREGIRAYGGEYAVIGGDPSPFWHDAVDLVGMENLYFLMYDNPEFVSALLARITDYYLAVSTSIFEEAGDLIDLFFLRNNFGSQLGPLLGTDQFRRFIEPCLRKLAELGHRYGIKVMLHSSGSFRPLIPLIADCGIDALHPLQPDCAGMGASGLLRDFGQRLVLCGGIDARNLVLPGPPGRVREGTLAVLRDMGGAGGYIASASVEALLDDTPPEHVLAMCDAIEEYSRSIPGRS